VLDWGTPYEIVSSQSKEGVEKMTPTELTIARGGGNGAHLPRVPLINDCPEAQAGNGVKFKNGRLAPTFSPIIVTTTRCVSGGIP
jgi:hypothetical protein